LLFLLGRNEDLSIAEIEEFLKKEENEIVSKTQIDNGLLVQVDLPLDERAIDKLGGTISIGEVIAHAKDVDLFKELEKVMIYKGVSNKLTYTLWDFSDMTDKCQEYLKKRFKSEKLKTAFKGLTGSVKTQDGEIEMKPSSKLLDEEYFIFEEEDEQYFGKITQHCDYKSIEMRDMEKPVRREELAIAPRLAKILINLAGLSEGEKLYDPFSGVGVMIQEALLQGMTGLGSEIDGDAVKGAYKNMEWFGFNKEDYEFIHHDSTSVDIPEVSAIVTEPDLGNVRKKIPTKAKAEETLRHFDSLIIGVINNVKGRVKGRIVFTSPYIRIGKKRLSCNIDRICDETGYSLVREPVPEYRDKQIVGRMIYVLSKESS
jgi:tRNA G10  N-methylase Trm11